MTASALSWVMNMMRSGAFKENVPSDEEFKNALKDYVLEQRRKLIEQAENFGKELGF